MKTRINFENGDSQLSKHILEQFLRLMQGFKNNTFVVTLCWSKALISRNLCFHLATTNYFKTKIQGKKWTLTPEGKIRIRQKTACQIGTKFGAEICANISAKIWVKSVRKSFENQCKNWCKNWRNNWRKVLCLPSSTSVFSNSFLIATWSY